MKPMLCLLAACLVFSVAMAGASSNPISLQFRLVVDSPTADSEPMTMIASTPGANREEVLNVQKTVLLDQTAVKHAMVDENFQGQPQIGVDFTGEGAKQLAAITRDNIGRRLAIVIDGKVYSAPRINSEISGGRAIISGAFTKQEAQDLAARLDGSPATATRARGRIALFCIAALVLFALCIGARFLVSRGRSSKTV